MKEWMVWLSLSGPCVGDFRSAGIQNPSSGWVPMLRRLEGSEVSAPV